MPQVAVKFFFLDNPIWPTGEVRDAVLLPLMGVGRAALWVLLFYGLMRWI